MDVNSGTCAMEISAEIVGDNVVGRYVRNTVCVSQASRITGQIYTQWVIGEHLERKPYFSTRHKGS